MVVCEDIKKLRVQGENSGFRRGMRKKGTLINRNTDVGSHVGKERV